MSSVDADFHLDNDQNDHHINGKKIKSSKKKSKVSLENILNISPSNQLNDVLDSEKNSSKKKKKMSEKSENGYEISSTTKQLNISNDLSNSILNGEFSEITSNEINNIEEKTSKKAKKRKNSISFEVEDIIDSISSSKKFKSIKNNSDNFKIESLQSPKYTEDVEKSKRDKKIKKEKKNDSSNSLCSDIINKQRKKSKLVNDVMSEADKECNSDNKLFKDKSPNTIYKNECNNKPRLSLGSGKFFWDVSAKDFSFGLNSNQVIEFTYFIINS